MICPYCNKELNKLANIGTEPPDMDARPMVCLFCGEISITENKQLRPLTARDVLAIVNAGFWNRISFDSYHIKDKLRTKKN